MALDIDTVFRDHIIKGDIHSGANDPDKAEIRALLKTLLGAAANPSIVKQTKAALDLVTPASEAYGGMVLNDSDPTKNGYYYRSSSTWVKGRGFPDTFAVLTSIGGTANAITASTEAGVNPADVLVVILPDPPGTNSTGGVTLAINGGTAAAVKNATGGTLAAGAILDGVGTMFFWTGTEWRQLWSAAGGVTVDHQGIYDNGATYTEGQIVTGSNGNWYQLKVPTVSGDNPVGSVTGNWLLVLNAGAIPPGAIGADEFSSDDAEIDAMRAKLRANQKPRLVDTLPLTNCAALVTWDMGGGVRHGFFGQYYDGGAGGYDQNSFVYEINEDGTLGDLVQTIATFGAYCATPFTIGADKYLFVSNYAKTGGGFTYSVNSVLYKWNGTSYASFQTFGLDGAVRAQYSLIGSDHYLAIASSVTGANNFSRFLYIYKWNGTTFTQVQAISTQGCYSGKVFSRSTDLLVATCEYTDGTSYAQVRSNYVNKWDGVDSFDAWKSFQGKGCSDVAVVEIEGEVYAAYINQFDGVNNDLGSPIYRVASTGLIPVCQIPTSFGIRVRAFTVGGRTILAYCSAAAGGSSRTFYNQSKVDLYIFDGAKAVLWHSIPAYGAYDVDIWENSLGQVFIAIANSISGTNLANDIDQSADIYELPAVPIATTVIAEGHRTPECFGQCRLVRVSNTEIRLDRHNGRHVTANGRPIEIPHGGILRDNSGLAANTTYQVYIYAHEDVPKLIISSRPIYLDPSTGMYVKDDDLRYTLVGQVTTDNNAQFPAAANVKSWFNTTLAW